MKIRIGKDITIRLLVLTNGIQEDLLGRDLLLLLTTPLKRTLRLDFTIEGSTVVSKIPGTEQKHIGQYDITLWENYGKEGQTVLDVCKAFELVEMTCMEDDTTVEGLDVEVVSLSGNMQVGVSGASAYEIAVENGFVGSVEEWLASLKGEKGDKFEFPDFTQEEIRLLQKPATDSAQVANEAASSANKAAEKAIDAAEKIPSKVEIIKNTNEILI